MKVQNSIVKNTVNNIVKQLCNGETNAIGMPVFAGIHLLYEGKEDKDGNPRTYVTSMWGRESLTPDAAHAKDAYAVCMGIFWSAFGAEVSAKSDECALTLKTSLKAKAFDAMVIVATNGEFTVLESNGLWKSLGFAPSAENIRILKELKDSTGIEGVKSHYKWNGKVINSTRATYLTQCAIRSMRIVKDVTAEIEAIYDSFDMKPVEKIEDATKVG